MIKIIAIGKIKEKPMQALIQEYEKRLKPIHSVEMIELTNSNKSDVTSIIEDECQRILEKIDDRDYVVLMDLSGKDLDSVSMSEKIMDLIDMGKPITFIIGGSHGVNQAIRERSNYRWKISNLTFPHQLVRLMLYEQVYRFFMISKNHPYHK
ncbi:23S rRNA (pseudouridine(1915)-N(3))-methyltransferase RlmH [Erysipelothrix rhusiopathiae]|uniref:23S rRNA (pseudouridine(1915)-N(3))-methyltransferase RlmH n=1 Tax=Erysipelothrix rhusiopathiae TaxID=1648 RepID=UPI000F437EEB|nr:23S rRNA (pseudouridine(1915)-N(3))-methyltransferase RlmH [Erysipelothrix rhusiopathiae]AYV33940.1 23S rRNA (pseudouridine(1915)-N(3))-methyltransferase RlmH [Erysipelothrix rhusiopathiae]MDE8081542.1 23S rRNA (pseudouridine(1915)-N(3))-methyltransferase RlmH [Erysipelothrix rhusiopathiae]MDE8313951.1 23S rRNA (pseudouridine(1915)-N(3))-methyltransferase RlmH [Erysipelothrix rhusiopathiae]MDE8328766.1 23S rRNA (pseudouridine(1915)-N(3))-methyltransferase RlmH [Erysipelothrix rhusiopathiae]